MAGKKAYRLFENGTDRCLTSPILLRQSAYTAKKGVGFTKGVAEFFYNLESNILQLSRELENRTYSPQPFNVFVVNDNKPRLIQAAHYRDRVVHHALCALIVPYLERSYLKDSYACQKGKGTHMALNRAKVLAKRYDWVAKLDVYHFFETIPHTRLMDYIRKRIGDKQLLEVLQIILSHGASTYQTGFGLPIGNLTSQHFGNFYLDVLDHRMKEHFGVRDFVRYMDDIVLFGHSKDELIDQVSLIQAFVEDDLLLRLKTEELQISPIEHGFPFLGFRLYRGRTRLAKDRQRRLRGKLRHILGLQNEEQHIRLGSLIDWTNQGQTGQLRRCMLYAMRQHKTRTL